MTHYQTCAHPKASVRSGVVPPIGADGWSLDPLDPAGGPLDADTLTWSLASTLRYLAGMKLDERTTS